MNNNDTTATLTYNDVFGLALDGNLPSGVRVELIGGKNSGYSATLTGRTRMDRRGNISIEADIDTLGVSRFVRNFRVI